MEQFETIPLSGEAEEEAGLGFEWEEEGEEERGRRALPRAPSGGLRSPAFFRPAIRPPSLYRRPVRPRRAQRTGPAPDYASSQLPSEHTRWIQSCLNHAMSLNLPISGILDPATRSALRSFQKKQGLPIDGIAGPTTESALASMCGSSGPPGAPEGAPQGGTEGPQNEMSETQARCPCAACRAEREAEAEFPFEMEAFEFEEGEQESWLGESAPARAPGVRGCATSFVDCPPPARPTAVLDRFVFDRSAIDPKRHLPIIQELARRIVASQSTSSPIREVLVAGHTDPAGDDDYNFGLARQRAEATARTLCAVVDRLKPGTSRLLQIRLTSCGERQVKGSPEESRRVEIFLRVPHRRGRGNPPDHADCGMPRRALQSEAGFELDLEQEFEDEAPRQAAVMFPPRLSLWQNCPDAARFHFQHVAERWARQIRALRSPPASDCPLNIGGTPYVCGADIVDAIATAHRCQGKRLEIIHIFSHSGHWGVFGPQGDKIGLYFGLIPPARARGARTVADIPTLALAENVTFILHGCNTASKDEDDNIARALYRHLAASLGNPRVFGHFDPGCAGRDNNWREYSARSPEGKIRLRTVAPLYEEGPVCRKKAK